MNNDQWVPISERLPAFNADNSYPGMDCSKWVLVTNGKNIFIALHQQDNDREFSAQWKHIGRDGYDCDGVTHWMPLPNLP